MILPLLLPLIALNLLQAKHFLVETEDKKENLDEEDRLLDLITEKQVSAIIEAFPDPQKAEQIYKRMGKSVQHAIRKKLHKVYGDDQKAVR